MKPITPQRMTWKKFQTQLWNTIRQTEAVIPRIYSDGKGIPTIGPGYAIMVGNKIGTYKLRLRERANRDLGHKLTDADWALLERQKRLLNRNLMAADLKYYKTTMVRRKVRVKQTVRVRGRTVSRKVTRFKWMSIWQAAGLNTKATKLTDVQRVLLAKHAIPDAVRFGFRLHPGDRNRFSLTLTDRQSKILFDRISPDHEKKVLGWFNTLIPRPGDKLPTRKKKLATLKKWGVTAQQIELLKKNLFAKPNPKTKSAGYGSREMIALFSLAYNGVPTPKGTVGALARGDRAEAFFEIVYRTNPKDKITKKRSVGVADRRNHEGAFMLPRRWTDADYNQFVAMKRRRAGIIRAYENDPDLTLLMRQGISRHGSLRRLRNGRIVTGRLPRLSKFFPGRSRDIDAILFGANNPNNTLRRLIEVGGLNGRLDGRPPVRRAALPRTPEARRAFLAKLTASVRSGGEASQAERDAFGAFVVGEATRKLLGSAVKRNLRNARRMAETDSDARAVAHLQTGLNDLARRDREGRLPKLPRPATPAGTAEADTQDAAPAAPPLVGAIQPLKVDGRLGPKTRRSLFTAAAKAGPAAVDQATALARFKDFARKAKTTGSPAGLGEAAQMSFGPLFGEAKDEGTALQGTINEIDAMSGGSGDVLAEDGVVGPKTEAAFSDTMSFADENDFANEFAFDHGFL
jgi:hypothetical protein